MKSAAHAPAVETSAQTHLKTDAYPRISLRELLRSWEFYLVVIAAVFLRFAILPLINRTGEEQNGVGASRPQKRTCTHLARNPPLPSAGFRSPFTLCYLNKRRDTR